MPRTLLVDACRHDDSVREVLGLPARQRAGTQPDSEARDHGRDRHRDRFEAVFGLIDAEGASGTVGYAELKR